MGLNRKSASGVFVNIVKGDFRQKVSEDTEGAVKREYEDKDKNKKIKHELIFGSVDGMIEGVKFKDTDFGTMLIITLDGVNISLGTSSNYFQDLAKKLPNIDFTESVSLAPFDFIGKNGKRVVGISITQKDEKLKNFYYDGEKNLHDFPAVDEEAAKTKKTYWKQYFLGVEEFLTEKVMELAKEKGVLDAEIKEEAGESLEKKEVEDDDLAF